MQVIGSMPIRSISQFKVLQSATILSKSVVKYSPGMPGIIGSTAALKAAIFMPNSSQAFFIPATFSSVMGIWETSTQWYPSSAQAFKVP